VVDVKKKMRVIEDGAHLKVVPSVDGLYSRRHVALLIRTRRRSDGLVLVRVTDMTVLEVCRWMTVAISNGAGVKGRSFRMDKLVCRA